VPRPGTRMGSAGYRCVTTISLGVEAEPGDSSGLFLEVEDEQMHMVRVDRSEGVQRTALCRPDTLSLAGAVALARVIAPYRAGVGGADTSEPMVADFELPTLLHVDDVDLWEPAAHVRDDLTRSRLRIPLGVDERGRPVELDIKEAAQGGMGPHGLLIGATGSGKSELLRTLVLGLALTHSSETLNFVLIDFKGGATFTKLDTLPHTSAVITNLADELPLVDRMNDAIDGELYRRQELLRRAGDFKSVHDYEQARAAGAPLAPLPSLLIVCDEFSELLTRKPEFIDLFLKIGR